MRMSILASALRPPGPRWAAHLASTARERMPWRLMRDLAPLAVAVAVLHAASYLHSGTSVRHTSAPDALLAALSQVDDCTGTRLAIGSGALALHHRFEARLALLAGPGTAAAGGTAPCPFPAHAC